MALERNVDTLSKYVHVCVLTQLQRSVRGPGVLPRRRKFLIASAVCEFLDVGKYNANTSPTPTHKSGSG